MTMRWLLGAPLVWLAAGTSCGGGPAPAAAPPPPSPPAATSTTSPTEPTARSTATPAALPTPLPMTFDAVFEEAPGALARYDFAPGELIDLAEGLFLVDTATGAVEGWALTSQLEGTNERDGRYAVSSDNGWIEAVAPSQKETFVHDRLHGRTFRLLSVNARLISGIQGGKTVVEFHLPDTQPYVVGAAIADLEARTLTWIQLDPPDQNNGVGPATFSGDGSQLLVRMYPRQYLVATDTGKGRLLAVAEPDEPPPGVSPLASGAGYSLWLAGEDRPTAYDWAGNSVEDDALTPFRIASSAGAFAYEWDSPRADGVAWTTLHTITLYRADGSPHLRLLGGHPAGAYGGGNVWLGDDSGLLVTTIEGLQLLTVEGDLRGGVAYGVPSPDNPDMMAIGAAVARLNGEILFAPNLDDSDYSTLSNRVWGDTSEYLRFTRPGRGKDFGVTQPLLAAVVQFPPLDEPRLRVTGADECLNFRDDPSFAGAVLACIPNGTTAEFTETGLPSRDRPGPASVFWQSEEEIWVHLELRDGTAGWANADFLEWAP